MDEEEEEEEDRYSESHTSEEVDEVEEMTESQHWASADYRSNLVQSWIDLLPNVLTILPLGMLSYYVCLFSSAVLNLLPQSSILQLLTTALNFNLIALPFISSFLVGCKIMSFLQIFRILTTITYSIEFAVRQVKRILDRIPTPHLIALLSGLMVASFLVFICSIGYATNLLILCLFAAFANFGLLGTAISKAKEASIQLYRYHSKVDLEYLKKWVKYTGSELDRQIRKAPQVLFLVDGHRPCEPVTDAHQALASLQARSFKADVTFDAPKLKPHLINWSGFVDQWTPIDPITPMEAYLRGNNVTKGTAALVTGGYWKFLMTGNITGSTKIFTKLEQYDNKSDNERPRIISNYDTILNALLASEFIPVAENLKTDLVYGLKPTGGMNPRELGRYVQQWLSGGDYIIYECDMSAFDANISKQALRIERMVYVKMGCSQDVLELFDQQEEWRVSEPMKGIFLKRDGHRASGGANTTLGNTNLNLILHKQVLDGMGLQPGVDYLMLALGDDNLLFMRATANTAEFEEKHTKFFKDICGMKPELIVHPVGTPIEEASYCSGYFGYDSNGELVWSADARKQIRKGLMVRDGDDMVKLQAKLSGFVEGFACPFVKHFGQIGLNKFFGG
ncbi:MAG: hypothetical protein NWF07_01955, partial [Candidatus Bathyarchaeota archaeon]|nr:hypothetical protein [Candidatus Bathyarchaeota archaeon]